MKSTLTLHLHGQDHPWPLRCHGIIIGTHDDGASDQLADLADQATRTGRTVYFVGPYDLTWAYPTAHTADYTADTETMLNLITNRPKYAPDVLAIEGTQTQPPDLYRALEGMATTVIGTNPSLDLDRFGSDQDLRRRLTQNLAVTGPLDSETTQYLSARPRPVPGHTESTAPA